MTTHHEQGECPVAALDDGDAGDGRRRAEAHERLLAWYATEGRVHLPWRHTRDPYAVLVSEIMLQQTQVERVLPKYAEFLARFPTLAALAAATPAEVIQAWSGLGYNIRAVRLREIAVQAVAENGGGPAGEPGGGPGRQGDGGPPGGGGVLRLVRAPRGPGRHHLSPARLSCSLWLERGAVCEGCPLAICCAACAEAARATLFPSGEALARLRDERAGEQTGPRALAETGRVAEARAAYMASGGAAGPAAERRRGRREP